jgi:hypothetical protein
MKKSILLLALFVATPARAQDPEPERVIMKLDEFLRLYETAKKLQEEPEKPPHDHAIASVRYAGEVVFDGDEPRSAVFKARMRLEVLAKKGWARVPILPATVALDAARIAGKDAPVVIENGWYTLVTDRRGSVDLDLEFGAAVTTAEGSSGIVFDLSPSGATTVTLAVPAAEELDFTVANAKIQSDRVVGKSRVVEASLPATGALSIQWQREIPEATKQDARIYSEVYTLVGLGEGVMRATATVQDTIMFAGVDKLDLGLPKGMTVLDVKGPGIRDWKATPDGKLEVLLNYAAEGSYGLTVELEKVIGKDEKVEAPIVEPLGVHRAKGWVGVEARGNLEIAGGKVTGATPVDVRSLPAAILGITGQPVLLGYKYLGGQATIPLEVEEHADVDVLVTLLDETRARTMWTLEGRRLTSVKYRIRNNRKQFLRLALPEGSELWSASVGGRAVQPAQAGDGRVMIPLVRSQEAGGALAAFEVEVVYVENGKPPADSGRGELAAKLPRADAPSTYVAWTIYAPNDAKMIRRTYDGGLQRVRYLSNPIPGEDLNYIETATPEVMAQAEQQAAPGGAMGEGAVPVPVSLPLQGKELHFEKLLALDEDLAVSFRYRGLRQNKSRR